MNVFMLMMGGIGTRFGASRPKQYTLIDNAPLFSYILKKADTVAEIDRIVVVCHKEWQEYAEEWARKTVQNKAWSVVSGGETRSQSVKNGLASLAGIADNSDVIMIHDATHPYVDGTGIAQIVKAVNQFGGATLASKNYDTVYRMDQQGFLQKVEPRDFIVAGASPEAFRFGDIYRIYEQASEEELAGMTSAGAIALAHQIPMKVIPTHYLNLKITYPGDMELFQRLIHSYFFGG